MPPSGYFGRALVVDATDGSSRILPFPDDVLRAVEAGVRRRVACRSSRTTRLTVTARMVS